jgi:hypothetical protein
MEPTFSRLHAATCTLAGVLALATAAHATEQQTITNAAAAASATRAPPAVRTMKFTTHHAVSATLTLHRKTAIESGWKPQVRFTGRTDFATCEFDLPKAGQQGQPATTATGTLTCTTPWQLDDNGPGFEAGRKVADGTLRP